MPAPSRQLGMAVALAGLSAYKSGAAQVAAGNKGIEMSAFAAASGGQALDTKTVALGVALGNLATKGLSLAFNGLKQIGQQIKTMAQEAGPVAGLKMAFEGLTRAAGTSPEVILSAMRAATGGMAPMRDMMESFNKGAQLISLDFAKKLPEAMRYLGKVSYATGQNMDYLMNSLVVGVGRMSPMILDNLAIQVKLSEGVERAAQMFGVEEDALTKTQEQMGMMNIVLEKLAKNTASMPDITGSATAGMQSLKAMMKDFRAEMGLAVLPVLSEFTQLQTRLANAVLPRVVSATEAVTAKVMGVIDAFKSWLPIEEIMETIRRLTVEVKVAMHDFGSVMGEVVQTWMLKLGLEAGKISEILRNRLLPIIQEIPAAFVRFWQNTMWPILQRGTDLFAYFAKAASDTLQGLRNLLQGNSEDARKYFTDAWRTALAVVLTLLKNAADGVITWGQALIQNYALGIIQGIKLFLVTALQSVAGFIRSMMMPGSPPKFLPDMGDWGKGTMEVYLEGMGEADFGVIGQFSGEFNTALQKMVEDGKLETDQFADAFFELRTELIEVQGEFKATGEIGPNAFSKLREQLGKTGEGLAELAEAQIRYTGVQEKLKEVESKFKDIADAEREMDMALRPYADALEDLRITQEDVADAARERYEAGEIGAEEYEDLVRAAKEKTDEAERSYKKETRAQRDERRAIEERKRLLEDEAYTLSSQGELLAEQIGILEGRLGLHKETLSTLEQEASMLEQLAAMANQMAAGLGAAKDEAEEMAEALAEVAQAQRGGADGEGGDDWQQALADQGPGLQFDFGSILPDVEEMRGNIDTFFDGLGTRIVEKIGEWAEPIRTKVDEIVVAATSTLVEGAWSAFRAKDFETAFERLGMAVEINFKAIGNAIYTWWTSNVSLPLYQFGRTIELFFQGIFGPDSWLGKLFSENIEGPLEGLKTAFGELQKIMESRPYIMMANALQRLKNALSIERGEGEEGVVKVLAGLLAMLTGALVEQAFVEVGEFINLFTDAIVGVTEGLEWLKDKGYIKWLTDGFNLLAQMELPWWLIPGSPTPFEKAITGITDAFADLFEKVSGKISTFVTDFGTDLDTMRTAVGEWHTEIFDSIDSLFKSLIGEEGIIPTAMANIYTAITGKFAEILAELGSPETLQKWIDLGTNLLGGLFTGIQDKVAEIKTWLAGAWTDIIKIAKKVLGIGSDSKVFMEIGEYTASGFLTGLKDGLDPVKQALEKGLIANVSPQAALAPVRAVQAASVYQRGGITVNVDARIDSEMDMSMFANYLTRTLHARL